MRRTQPIAPVLVLLAAACWTVACGDGTTDPPPADPPRATTVTVTPAAAELTALGETVRFTAQVLDQNGNVMAGAAVTWSSSDASVAAVDASGLATAAGSGTATITATSGSASGTAAGTVAQAPGSVVVTPAADTVTRGDTLRLSAEAFDDNGHVIANADFEWTSSDTSVASVDDSGLVLGVAQGMATIRAASGDAQGTSEITAVESPDRAALVALYEATDVDNANWLTDAPLDDWYGVDTDASGRVVRLELPGRWNEDWEAEQLPWIPHGLTGPIPPEVGNLSGLKVLDLHYNQLGGPIPAELGNLANLQSLNLGYNPLGGPIPAELGNLANLRRLDLAANRLTGPIPPEFSSLSRLYSLSLWDNDLTGPIPVELGSLANLRSLSLNNNQLNGLVPAEFGDLGTLRGLDLSYNDLTGPIPRTFLQLDRLGSLWIGQNEGLCVPGSAAFVAWVRGIERRDDDAERLFCNVADAAVLGRLYELAGGTGWTRSDGWANDGALEERHGVSADSLGRVTALDLTANGLDGRLPPNLGPTGPGDRTSGC